MTRPELDRSSAPEPGPMRTFEVPPVVLSELENGLSVRVARTPAFPVVTLALVLPAGESAVPDGREGVAVLTGDALEGGTERRSGADFARALEERGARLSVRTGWDATIVSATCLADRLEEVAELLAEVARSPAFPDDEVERTRNQQLARIRQREKDPSSLASIEGARLLYRDGEPYGRSILGSVGSVGQLGPDELRDFREARYRPGGSGLVVVGDVLPDAAHDLAERHFASWEGRVQREAPPAGRARSTERRVHVVHRPGAVQSELRIGHPGAARSTSDYIALRVGNLILGGNFSSRLNLALREARGFTYGVRSTFSFRRGPGPWWIRTGVANDVTAPAVAEALVVSEGLRAGGATEDEVASARDYLAGIFPLQLESTGQLARRISGLVIYDLSDDWYQRYRDRVRAVTREEVDAALRRHVRPLEAQIVVVGDADEVVGPLEALELAPVTVHG